MLNLMSYRGRKKLRNMHHTFCSSLNANIIKDIREGEGQEIRMGEAKIFLQNCSCVESWE